MNHHPLTHFTSDWVTSRLKEWEVNFIPLDGKPIRILEVGSYEGRSACWFLQHIMNDPKSELICVDPWGGVEGAARLRRFDMNVALSGRSNQVCRIQAKILDVHNTIPGEFDLIYIDGDHVAKEVLTQAAVLWRKLKPEGLLLFDDYRWPSQNNGTLPPGPGIDAFLTLWDDSVEVVFKDYQALVRKKV